MTVNAILNAIDNPAEAAILLERRQTRRRRWLIVIGVIVVVVSAVAWKIVRHELATAWLRTNRHQVHWESNAKNWRLGGASSVKYVPSYGSEFHHQSDIGLVTWLHRVEELDLNGASNVSDEELQVLERLGSLQSLYLDRSKRFPWAISDDIRPTDITLGRIKWLKSLQNLNISGNSITDEGLINLSGLTQLKDLEMRDTAITDAGLPALYKLPGLKSLDLLGTKVTIEGIKKFEAVRPDVKVLSNFDSASPSKSSFPR